MSYYSIKYQKNKLCVPGALYRTPSQSHNLESTLQVITLRKPFLAKAMVILMPKKP